MTKAPIPQEILDGWFAPATAPTVFQAVPPGKRRGEPSTSYISCSCAVCIELICNYSPHVTALSISSSGSEDEAEPEVDTEEDEVEVVKFTSKLCPRPTKRIKVECGMYSGWTCMFLVY